MLSPPEIVVISEGPMHPRELRRLVDVSFEDMVRVVVDVKKGVAAVGGRMHAEAERVLVEAGSRPADLWGASYWPGRGREGCVECAAPINVRPAQGNASAEIQDPELRRRVRELTFALIGDGEALP